LHYLTQSNILYNLEKYVFVKPNSSYYDDARNWLAMENEWVRTGTWVQISEEEALAMLDTPKDEYPKYYMHKDRVVFGGGGIFVRRTSKSEMEFVRPNSTTYDQRKWGPEEQWVQSGAWFEIPKEEADKLIQSDSFPISLEQGKQLIAKKNHPAPYPVNQDGQYELMNGQIVNLINRRCRVTDGIKSDDGHALNWLWCTDGTMNRMGHESYYKQFYVKRYIGPIIQESVTQTTITGEEEMKSETAVAIAKGTGNLALRALNYWAWEPAKNMGSRVLSSIRYVTFFASIAACIAAYNYPAQTKALVKSALPKIHFSVERPELLK
jgi:hypothetical protein